MTDQFYLQDNRSYVGNDVLFWRDGGGYTTDLSKAEIFTKQDALRQNQCRETDVPWPKEYMDAKTRPAVDVQYVNIKEALQGLDIELKKPERIIKQTYHCHSCGAFISEARYYAGYCKKCGSPNAL